MDKYSFYTGKTFDAYEVQGAHVKEDGVEFATFAPGAVKISVIGDFSDWKEMQMEREEDQQFFRLFVKGAKEGQRYKYKIYGRDGSVVDHCDPYGFGMELRPQSASIIRDLHSYTFKDSKWMEKRTDCKKGALNIYELHLGSWRENPEDENGWFTYPEIAKQIIPYVKECGYNYIEVLPLSEHPCDESWGYQNTGFFSPTARYGSCAELMEFVDICHQNDIGVIMDFVPVHFAVDAYALANYDGTALYEYPHQDVGVSEWGSKNFMHSRGEVQSFLQSAANYWIKEYHFDGIRMDAISNIIYWQGDARRGVNNNAVEFVRRMNQFLKDQYPSVILIAEDSSSFDGVTKSASQGGLGFDYKWDMGWMNDTLNYFRTAPEYRYKDYHKLTFSMMYFGNENYLLPLSHDEVVHGKATIIQKMWGDYEEKFSQVKALYMYMYAHPGKKLNFMGNELGHFREWDEKRQLDWNLLEYQKHQQFHAFMKELNRLYLKEQVFFDDYSGEGFQWVDCHKEQEAVYAISRAYKNHRLVALFNFSDVDREYRIPLEENVELKGKKLRMILNSNDKEWGGGEDSEEVMESNDAIGLKRFSAKFYIVEDSQG